VNIKKWESLKINNYQFEYTHNCFCSEEYRGPFKIEVKNGEVFSVNGVLGNGNSWVQLPTIDSLFQFVEKSQLGNYETLTVKYDPNYGFPTDFWIDPNKMIADEEFGFSLSNFQKK
ncbi:MAG: hypothetical protein RIR51_509, partial [Bacteroidota bacterium]